MATTTNFGWETPDDTDLVKDGALAIRTLGSAIDTSLVDLKGGTTGQVLSKTSNTDMDFTWVTSDDANAIQNTIVDAKGDLISASAADVPARLAVGNDGETLLADSSQTTGLRWGNNYGFTAGKNRIINGNFNINQRGFSSSTTNDVYTFDRWKTEFIGGTVTWSSQTLTLGSITGYESSNNLRIVTASQSAASDYASIVQKIEDVRTLANQTVTISFWAKASSGTPSIAATLYQAFGSGGSATVANPFGKVAISTSWARYSLTATLPSLSGKTIGTNSALSLYLFTSAGSTYNSEASSLGIQNATIDIWGVQVEAGNVATAFQTATGTLAGELAACQRYYQRWSTSSTAGTANSAELGVGEIRNSTTVYLVLPTSTPMRGSPSFGSSSGTLFSVNSAGKTGAATAVGANNDGYYPLSMFLTVSGYTAGQAGFVFLTSGGWVEARAEL